MNNVKNKHILIIFSFLIIAILSHIFLMCHHVLFDAWDMQFHYKRIIELAMMLKNHTISPFAFNQFHGSAVFASYPYINLLPIIVLSTFIKSKIYLIYLFFIFNTFISLIISFYSSYAVNKNTCISYIFSVVYSISTVSLGYNYYFMDIGLSSAVTFLPLVVFGLILLFMDDSYLELSLGLILILFSHILSFVIVLMFIFIIIIINYNRLSAIKIIKLVKSLVLALMITSIDWIPMLFIFINNKINLPRPVKISGLPNTSILRSFIGLADPQGLGTFAIISIFISFLFYKKFNHIEKQFFGVSISIIFICSKLFPWNFLPKIFINFMSIHFQYTYRFLIIPILILDYLLAIIVVKFINIVKLKYLFIILILVGAIILRVGSQYEMISININNPDFSRISSGNSIEYKLINNHSINDLINYDYKANGNNPDYYPVNSLSKINHIRYNKGEYNNHKLLYVRNNGFNKFKFNNNDNISKLSLPILIYRGECLHLYLNHHPIRYYVNRNSTISIYDIRKGNNILKIKYVHNLLLIVFQGILFIVGALWVIIYFLCKYMVHFKFNPNTLI